MSRVTEAQEAAITRLNMEYKSFRAFEKVERARLMEELHEELAQRVANRRALIAEEASRLHREGVSAARLGKDVFETKAYITYKSFLETPEKALPADTEVRFDFTSDDTFVVTLANWGKEHLTGTASFSKIEGEWMNTDTENEVGNYVEQSLFVNRDDEGLVERFSESQVPTES